MLLLLLRLLQLLLLLALLPTCCCRHLCPCRIDMDEVSNFCSGDICKFRAGAPPAPLRALSRAELRDDPPWVGGWVQG